MADPGNSSDLSAAEFSPAELDRLEDALEPWTGADFDAVAEDSSLPAPLRARLADYREVLTLSRDALALEDVPEGLLASVLAEAHASAASAPLPAQRAPAGPSLWERLRRSLLLPGVALAGSTALLLWLVQPGADADELLASRSEQRSPPSVAPAPNAAPEPARLTPGDGPAPAGPAPAELAPAELAGSPSDRMLEASKADAAPATAPSAAQAGRKEADAKPESKGASKPSRRKDDLADDLGLGDKSDIEVLPGLDGAPTQDADKETLRDTLELADTKRRAGRCDAAMALYLQAFEMNGPPDEQARARAGYGLCLASQGEDGKADQYFDHAIKASPGLAGWIARERGEGASTKKRASKPSPAKSKLPPIEPK